MCHICRFCNKEFKSGQSLGAHIVHCSMNPNSHQEEFQKRKKENFEKQNPLEEHVLKCPICGNEYTIQVRHKQFEQGKYKKTCSDKCAKQLTALNTNKESKNEKIANSLKGKSTWIAGMRLVDKKWVQVDDPNLVKNHSRICKYCGNIFSTLIRKRSKYCSDDCKIKDMHDKLSAVAKENNLGGYHPNSIKKHHHGTYKGIHCDSSWELAYLVWCLEHDISIKRCEEIRYYKLNKKTLKYFPDFIVDNQIIEIKGYFDEKSRIKSEQNPDIKVLFYDDLKEMIEYTINKYGNNFWEILYD